MAMSGVTVADEVVTAMANVRMKRSRYAVLNIGADGKQIVVTEEGARDATFDAFKARIATDEPCYAAFDYEYDDGGIKKDKVLLVQWIPDTAKPRAKMLYSASRDALNAAAEGFLPVQANDAGELEAAEILRKIKSHRSN